MKLHNSGLLPTPPDERDFKLGDITDLPDLSTLPESFEVAGVKIYDQKDSDFCSQFMACNMSQLQEGVDLSPEWAFAVSKKDDIDKDSFGQDLRSALRVHTNHGVPEKKDCPFSVENKDSYFLRRIENYPDELWDKAIEHVKKSYFKVTGQYDHFDNIRATIWKYRYQKRIVGSGVDFGWDSDDKILDQIPTSGSGHAITYTGWRTFNKELYLVLTNSYGTDVGDKGKHYVSRKVVNYFVEKYGAYTFLDMDPETVKYMVERGIRDRDSWIVQLLKSAVSLLKELVKKKP